MMTWIWPDAELTVCSGLFLPVLVVSAGGCCHLLLLCCCCFLTHPSLEQPSLASARITRFVSILLHNNLFSHHMKKRIKQPQEQQARQNENEAAPTIKSTGHDHPNKEPPFETVDQTKEAHRASDHAPVLPPPNKSVTNSVTNQSIMQLNPLLDTQR